jgi:hypothetical protein
MLIVKSKFVNSHNLTASIYLVGGNLYQFYKFNDFLNIFQYYVLRTNPQTPVEQP